MRILIDICHPAHFHFFKTPARMLRDYGHEVHLTSRRKEFAIELLDAEGMQHHCISVQNEGSIGGMAGELVRRSLRLRKFVREIRPDVMTAVGGTFVAQTGFLTRVPSVVFYDTENARLQNLITYPFCSRLMVPDCYEGWTPKNRTTRYRGYHELCYLAPEVFSPSRDVAIENGLDPRQDTFIVRLVSWKSNHDMGETGWSIEFLRRVVECLKPQGKVIISSEADLPADLRGFRYRGCPARIHHLMAYSRMVVGESATMASEAAVLGVPAVYIADESRGYLNELEETYGLVRVLSTENAKYNLDVIRSELLKPIESHRASRARLLKESDDVPAVVVDSILASARVD